MVSKRETKTQLERQQTVRNIKLIGANASSNSLFDCRIPKPLKFLQFVISRLVLFDTADVAWARVVEAYQITSLFYTQIQ